MLIHLRDNQQRHRKRIKILLLKDYLSTKIKYCGGEIKADFSDNMEKKKEPKIGSHYYRVADEKNGDDDDYDDDDDDDDDKYYPLFYLEQCKIEENKTEKTKCIKENIVIPNNNNANNGDESPRKDFE